LLGRGRLDEAGDAFFAAAQGIDLEHATLEAAELLHEMGRLHYKQATWDQAVKAYRISLAYRLALLGTHEDTATSWHHLGATLRFVGELKPGREALLAAVQMRRDLLEAAPDDSTRQRLRLAIANGLNSIAVALSTHKPEVAKGLFAEALEVMLSEGVDESADWRIASLRHNIGMCMVSLNQLDRASPMLMQALTVKKRQGNLLQIANTQFELARLAMRRGDLPSAQRWLGQAMDAQRGSLPPSHPVRIRSALLEIEVAIARDELAQAQSLLQSIGTVSDQARDFARGLIAQAQDDVTLADGLLRRAHRAFAQAHGESSPSARKVAQALALLWTQRDNDAAAFWQDKCVIHDVLDADK
jgi:tetratricopeptide (TPR) repeat protein